MRVCHTVPTFSPVVGGAEVNVENIVITQHRQGQVQPRVLTLNVMPRWRPADLPDTNYIRGEIPIDRVPVTAVNRFSRKLRLHMTGGRFSNLVLPRNLKDSVDLLHHHDEVDLSIVNAFSKVRLPALLHIRSLGFLYEELKGSYLRRKALLSSADHFVCNSSFSASYMMKLGLLSSKISVVPNAVDPLIFAPSARVKSDRLSLVWVARGTKSKGLHTLARALTNLGMPIKLDVVLGDLSDFIYIKEQMIYFANISRSKDIKICWHIALDQDALIGLYQAADCYVGTAPDEPFGNTNIEAMACGAVPVLPKSGGCLDIVTHGNDGFFYHPGDPAALARALSTVHETSNTEWVEYRKNGNKTIHKRFSLDSVTESLTNIYDLIV